MAKKVTVKTTTNQNTKTTTGENTMATKTKKTTTATKNAKTKTATKAKNAKTEPRTPKWEEQSERERASYVNRDTSAREPFDGAAEALKVIQKSKAKGESVSSFSRQKIKDLIKTSGALGGKVGAGKSKADLAAILTAFVSAPKPKAVKAKRKAKTPKA